MSSKELKEEDCTVHYDRIYNVVNPFFVWAAQQFCHTFCPRYRLEACNSVIDADGLDLAGFFGIEKILKV